MGAVSYLVSPPRPGPNLHPDAVRDLLAEHGLVDADANVRLEVLGGGVSSHVLSATVPERDLRYVVKFPLDRFRVPDEWVVDVRRGQVEYEMARFLSQHLGEDHVIGVRAYDEKRHALILDAAPAGWHTWKELLLAQRIAPRTAEASARLLARLHGLTLQLTDTDQWREDDLFTQQRIAPYFETAAERVPKARDALMAVQVAFFSRNDLVHGDYSPKNLFVDPDMARVRLIDHEVTTRGDAAFDAGFMVSHLVLKGIHMPSQVEALNECARVFLQTYLDNQPPVDEDSPEGFTARALSYMGALVLARAVGKSRAEYLDERGRGRAKKAGLALLQASPDALDEALDVVAASGV